MRLIAWHGLAGAARVLRALADELSKAQVVVIPRGVAYAVTHLGLAAVRLIVPFHGSRLAWDQRGQIVGPENRGLTRGIPAGVLLTEGRVGFEQVQRLARLRARPGERVLASKRRLARMPRSAGELPRMLMVIA
jgi:hypothetical protein